MYFSEKPLKSPRIAIDYGDFRTAAEEEFKRVRQLELEKQRLEMKLQVGKGKKVAEGMLRSIQKTDSYIQNYGNQFDKKPIVNPKLQSLQQLDFKPSLNRPKSALSINTTRDLHQSYFGGIDGGNAFKKAQIAKYNKFPSENIEIYKTIDPSVPVPQMHGYNYRLLNKLHLLSPDYIRKQQSQNFHGFTGQLIKNLIIDLPPNDGVNRRPITAKNSLYDRFGNPVSWDEMNLERYRCYEKHLLQTTGKSLEETVRDENLGNSLNLSQGSQLNLSQLSDGY